MKRLACLFAMPALLSADWKIVTRTGASTLTEYFKGSLTRTDSSPAYTTVMDSEHRRQVNWRNDLRQYEIVEWPPEVQPNSETLIDGWYIEAPGLPKAKSGSGGYFTFLTITVAGQSPPRIELQQVGPAPEGLAVWQKMTSTVVLPGSTRHHESVSEVTELFERPLPDTLFQLPDGYQRVTILPYAAFRLAPRTWAELIRERWQKITDWFSALF